MGKRPRLGSLVIQDRDELTFLNFGLLLLSSIYDVANFGGQLWESFDLVDVCAAKDPHVLSYHLVYGLTEQLTAVEVLDLLKLLLLSPL